MAADAAQCIDRLEREIEVCTFLTASRLKRNAGALVADVLACVEVTDEVRAAANQTTGAVVDFARAIGLFEPATEEREAVLACVMELRSALIWPEMLQAAE